VKARVALTETVNMDSVRNLQQSTVLVGLAILLFCGTGSAGYAAPNAVEYELQERCGKRVAEIWAKEYGATTVVRDASGHTWSYENHYSSTFNKCFFLEILATTEKEKISLLMRLFDINENKEYGSFYSMDQTAGPTDCQVRGTRCRSEKEWRDLIKPFMED
jgi:hypothetical protein